MHQFHDNLIIYARVKSRTDGKKRQKIHKYFLIMFESINKISIKVVKRTGGTR